MSASQLEVQGKGAAAGRPPVAEGPFGSPLAAAVALRDRDILAMVREALERGDTLLAFQPVVDAARTGRVAFQEGLIRVIDDTGRIIPAAEFMDACEMHETGRLLDTRALEMGLEALRRVPDLRLSINMSARSIGDARWTDALERGTAGDPTVAERLILEITERSAMTLPEVTVAFMERLQRRGVAFALDDFGSGYTSFRYLRDFDFDILKIAGEFVRGVGETPDNRVLVEALVGIARHFDMFTVAESVETAGEAAMMRGLGVDCLQGYLFGMPTTSPEWDRTEQRDRASA